MPPSPSSPPRARGPPSPESSPASADTTRARRPGPASAESPTLPTTSRSTGPSGTSGPASPTRTGGAVSRIRLDAELRRAVNGRAERARATHGRKAADRERRRVAGDLDLPVRDDGRVLYPDAQIEYAGEDGRDPGRVNIEIVSEHYREGSVAQKALAGFAIYGANNAAGRAVASGLARAARSLAKSGDSGGGAAGRRDDPASVEL